MVDKNNSMGAGRRVRLRSFATLLFGLLLPAVSAALTLQMPLSKLAPSQTMTLTCTSDEQSVSIPLPDRWIIRRATIDLHYTSSNNMLGELAQLAVKVNNVPVAQTKLNPSSPDVLVKLNLPVQYLEPGYNKIAFAASQHIPVLGKQCEKPCSPDLWTTINLKDSILELEYEEMAVPLALSSIADFLFDPKTLPEGHVNLITEDQSAESLTSLGIVSSGIARRYDYRKVTFTVSQDVVPGIDNVLVGRKAFVDGFLNARGLSLGKVEGGYLKIFALPAGGGQFDAAHVLLSVTGEQYDQVKLAAETFANISFGFPGSPELNAYSFKMPEIEAYGGRDVVHANKTYTFKTLNFPSTTFKGLNPTGKTINFRLPVDFLIQQNLSAKLHLSFAYGAGLHDTSALNIIVNDKAVKAIHLGNKEGSFFDDYVVDIPTYLFKPGGNVIAFGVEMHPPLQECDVALLGNMFLTIFEKSTLTFPDMPHFVELPKLELFMLNGFPFTRWPDGFESKIYLSEVNADSVAATMNLVGMITQKNGFPLLATQIDVKPPKEWKGELIVIGPPGKIPPEFEKKAALFLGEKSNIPYPVVRDWDGEYTIANSKQTSRLGEGRGYLMEFGSPYEPGRSVLIIAAENGGSLLKFSQTLLDPDVQAKAEGGLMLVDMGAHFQKPRVYSYKIGESYTTGKAGKASLLESYLYAHPYVYYALMALLGIGLAYAILWALRRYRASRKLGRTSGK